MTRRILLSSRQQVQGAQKNPSSVARSLAPTLTAAGSPLQIECHPNYFYIDSLMTAKRAPEEDSSTMSDPTKKVKVTDAVHAGNKEAADHHDKHGDDWVREPPFQLGTAPKDFKPKYRQRCWCGKSW